MPAPAADEPDFLHGAVFDGAEESEIDVLTQVEDDQINMVIAPIPTPLPCIGLAQQAAFNEAIKAQRKSQTHAPETHRKYDGEYRRFMTFVSSFTWKDKLGAAAFTMETPNRDVVLLIYYYFAVRCGGGLNGLMPDGRTCSKTTVDAIHAALVFHFETQWDVGRDAPWLMIWNPNTKKQEPTGNPMRAPRIASYVRGLRKHLARGKPVQTAFDVTVEDVEVMCKHVQGGNVQSKISALEGLMWTAYWTTAFFLWTRSDELKTLTLSQCRFDVAATTSAPAHHQITLLWRKNNQFDAKNKHPYSIPHLDHEPAGANAFFPLSAWLDAYSKHVREVGGRELHGDDPLCPSFNATGLRIGQTMLPGLVSSRLQEVAKASGVANVHSEERISPHCFRRGGAQYRFCHALRRWPLFLIKWWGGWADNETPNQLCHYLLSQQNAKEKSHGTYLLDEAFKFQGSQGDELTGGRTISSIAPPATNFASFADVAHETEALAGQMGSLSVAVIEKVVAKVCRALVEEMQTIRAELRAGFAAMAKQGVQRPHMPTSSGTKRSSTASTFTPSPDISPNKPCVPSFTPAARIIPDCNRGLKGAGKWFSMAQQYLYGDRERGLPRPLKEMNQHEFHPSQRSKYRQRCEVGREYERLGSNRAAFVAVYPRADEAKFTTAMLLKAFADRGIAEATERILKRAKKA